jgi:hypothetical protein
MSSPEKQTLRNLSIAEDVLVFESYQDVSVKYGLTVTRVQAITKRIFRSYLRIYYKEYYNDKHTLFKYIILNKQLLLDEIQRERIDYNTNLVSTVSSASYASGKRVEMGDEIPVYVRIEDTHTWNDIPVGIEFKNLSAIRLGMLIASLGPISKPPSKDISIFFKEIVNKLIEEKIPDGFIKEFSINGSNFILTKV